MRKIVLFVLLLATPLAVAQALDFGVGYQTSGGGYLEARANLPLGDSTGLWALPELRVGLGGSESHFRVQLLADLEPATLVLDLLAPWKAGGIESLEGRLAARAGLGPLDLEAGYRVLWTLQPLQWSGGGLYLLSRLNLNLGNMWGVGFWLLPEAAIESGVGGNSYAQLQLLADLEHMSVYALARTPWREGGFRAMVFEIGAYLGVDI